jgi:hypothetical protein
MSKPILRQRFVISLIVAIACLGAAPANALPESASALESQAQAEFAKVGAAVRERLDREAAGDVIGAHIAAQNAQGFRYRFLDIKRAISRLRSPTLASPSVEAPRNPFLPDAAFLASSGSQGRGAPPVGRQEAVVRAEYPSWDMYRPHDVRDRGGNQGVDQHPEWQATPAAVAVAGLKDMYSHGVMTPTAGQAAAVATDLPTGRSPAEPPREPFLVYRERLAGRDSRE